jgi:hypothetical protein
MAAVTRSQFVALIPTDNRLTDPASSLWSTYTSITQAGPTAGVPEAQGDYEVVLQASGAQEAAGSITTRFIQGGMPDAAARSAGYVYRDTADAATEYLGWEPPASIAAWEPVVWTASGTSDYRRHPHAVTLADGSILCAVERYNSTVGVGITNGYGVWVYKRSASTGAWTGYAVFDPADTTNYEGAYRPCLVVVGERVFCFAWVHDPRYGSDRCGIRVWCSTDDGVTWTQTSETANTETDTYLSVAFAGTSGKYGIGRLRGAYNNGQIVIFAALTDDGDAYADVLRQWASDDLGQNLRLVFTSNSTIGIADNGAVPDVIAYQGGFMVAFASRPTGGTTPNLYSARLTSAYQNLDTADAVVIVADASTYANTAAPNVQFLTPQCAITADESGTLWAFYPYNNNAASIAERLRQGVSFSENGGKSWQIYGVNPDAATLGGLSASWWRNRDTGNNYPIRYCATIQRGRVVLLANHYADNGTNDDSLSAFYLGGWSQLTQSRADSGLAPLARTTWEVTHLPIERAEDQSVWTLTNAGTSACSLTSSGRERFTAGDGAGASGRRYVTWTAASAGSPAGIVQWTSYAVQGGNTSTFDRVATRIRVGTAANGSDITIRQSDTAFKVLNTGGADLLSVSGLTAGPVQFRIGIQCDGATQRLMVAYRSFTTNEAREWTISALLTPADDGGAAGAFNLIEFGCIEAGSGAATQVIGDWYEGPHFSFNNSATSAQNVGIGDAVWWRWVKATHNPGSLSPRRLASTACYTGGGVSVAAVDGPALAGDTHVIETRYRYPIENVWPEVARSPRTGWRSTTLDQHDIAWKLSPGLVTVTHRPEGAYTAITLRGINWRTATLSYSDAPASFVSMISIDAASGMSGLTFTRTGATIRANSAGTSLYFAENELAGYTVDLGSSVYRRILGNSEGMWTSSGDFPRCVIQLESAAGADPASGSALSIWSTEVVAYINSQNAIGYRLRIDAQTTVDGYLAIGEARIGPMLILGKSPSAERQVEFVPGVQIDDLPDGSTRAALVAPGRRTVDIAWTDGVRTDEFHGTRSAYVRATGSGGVDSPSIPAATPYSLEGLMRRVGTGFVTYLPRVVYGTDSAIFNRRHQHITGTLGDRVRVETTNAKAAENSTEFVRIATVKIREEV